MHNDTVLPFWHKSLFASFEISTKNSFISLFGMTYVILNLIN